MKTETASIRIIADEGMMLVHDAEDIRDVIVASEITAPIAHADSWREITAAEADDIRARQQQAIEAEMKAHEQAAEAGDNARPQS